jgi:membrane-associated phospholipid phosphatase
MSKGRARHVAQVIRATETLVLRALRPEHRPTRAVAAAASDATAAAWEEPVLGAIAVALALTVTWSRAATGRHFPTDLAVGSACGIAAGTAVHLALHPSGRREEDVVEAGHVDDTPNRR